MTLLSNPTRKKKKKQPFLKYLLNKKEKLCNSYNASNLILIVDYRSICKATGVDGRATKQVQAFFYEAVKLFFPQINAVGDL